jgi:hypothetical protein
VRHKSAPLTAREQRTPPLTYSAEPLREGNAPHSARLTSSTPARPHLASRGISHPNESKARGLIPGGLEIAPSNRMLHTPTKLKSLLRKKRRSWTGSPEPAASLVGNRSQSQAIHRSIATNPSLTHTSSPAMGEVCPEPVKAQPEAITTTPKQPHPTHKNTTPHKIPPHHHQKRFYRLLYLHEDTPPTRVEIE